MKINIYSEDLEATGLVDLLRNEGHKVTTQKFPEDTQAHILIDSYGNKTKAAFNVGTGDWVKLVNEDWGYKKEIAKLLDLPLAEVYEPGEEDPYPCWVYTEEGKYIAFTYHKNQEGKIRQEFIEGDRVVLEAWWNGSDFYKPYFVYQEYNRIAAGMGPEYKKPMGISGIFVDNCRLYDSTFGKIVIALRKLDYMGPIRIKLIITEESIIIEDIQAGINLISLYCMSGCNNSSIGTYLLDAITGRYKDKGKDNRYYIAVRIIIPDSRLCAFNPPLGMIKGAVKNDIMLGNSVGFVIDRGLTTREVRQNIYNIIKDIQVYDIVYRYDIGKRLVDFTVKLNKLKWI